MSDSPTSSSDQVEWDIYNFPLPAMTPEELSARKANLLEAAKIDMSWRFEEVTRFHFILLTFKELSYTNLLSSMIRRMSYIYACMYKVLYMKVGNIC